MARIRALVYIVSYTLFMAARILARIAMMYIHLRLHMYRTRLRMAREFRKALRESGVPRSLARQLAVEYSEFLSKNYRIPGVREIISLARRIGGFTGSPRNRF